MDDNIPPMCPSAPPPPPPPPGLPPLVMPSPSKKSPKGGRGWMVFSFILLGILLVMFAGRMAHFIGGLSGLGGRSSVSRHGSRGLDEILIEDNGSRHKVAVIEVDGIISGEILDGRGHNLVSLIKDELDLATADHTVKAVLLKVDSPGGEVMASDEISQAIKKFQEDSGKPVVASFGGLAASGGYYISAPCQYIVAHELTITGSIGVLMHSWNYRGLMNKVGVRPEVFKSGRFKDMLSGEKSDEEILPEERPMIQALIEQTFARFKEVVREGRREAQEKNRGKGRTLVKDWETYADGRILSGQQAYEYGFVDELGDFETAFKQARKLAGIPDAQLIRYEQPFDLSNILRLFGKTEAPSLKIDLGADLPKIQAGRLYFLLNL